MRYDTRIDPFHTTDAKDINSNFDATDYVWAHTSHLPSFRGTLTTFYRARLALARKLIRVFALALDLPETYFDALVTTPGADAVHIHYPGTATSSAQSGADVDVDVGIGSHTDIQCLTLLWQDMSGGLQVLSAADEWLDARPIAGTLVVNIGDFLQRLSNNKFKSTVHRVFNRQEASRYAMPFFLGFNPDYECKVLETCVDEEHPPLYEPISCGKVSLLLSLIVLSFWFLGLLTERVVAGYAVEFGAEWESRVGEIECKCVIKQMIQTIERCRNSCMVGGGFCGVCFSTLTITP